MGKKNLEQLFKESFKDFQETPDERVWKSIEASLDEKKQKKRVVPIWWRLGGVAAVLAVLFYVINPFDNKNNGNNIIVTETQEENSPTQQDSVVNPSNDLNRPSVLPNGTEQLAESENDSNLENRTETNTEKDTRNSINNNQSITSQKGLANVDVEEKRQPQRQDDIFTATETDEKVAANDNTPEKQRNLEADETDITQVADTNEKSSSKNPIQEETEKEQKLFENLNTEEAEAVAENNTEKAEEKENEAIAQNEDENQESEKKSIFEVIAEQEEEALAENSSTGKWSIGPSVAPVYFSATGDGSPIHSNFASNAKSGNVNLSYGLTVAYDLGKRVKIRSGVHRVDYGYDTNEVLFSSSLEGSTNDLIDNINYSQTSRNLVLQSKNSVPDIAADNASFELASNETPSLDGKMVQQLGYVEVPLEIDYALIDKKFGVNLIGGVSSLFLVENSVLLESEDLVTEVGEANNANSVNFSTNIGVGLNYEFSPKVQLNVEPVFKYQLNTFSETAGSFRPFSVGVYSGVSFKF